MLDGTAFYLFLLWGGNLAAILREEEEKEDSSFNFSYNTVSMS
jgi:hypothetical protein